MLIRRPVAAGRFYSDNTSRLSAEVDAYLGISSKSEKASSPWGLMLPHAGYIFCGNVIGNTLAKQHLPSHLVILCPNHTGKGKPLGVWPEGIWQTPLGNVPVDSELADKIISTNTGFQADAQSHLGEHSIEVLLPFLQKQVRDLKITPICVGVQNPAILNQAAKGLAKVLKRVDEEVGLIISSDMNHYENDETTRLKDQLALNEILANNPDGLLETVAQNRISMCGAAPMALALYTARELGILRPELIAHETSARASGDYNHTVGYAGMRLYM